MKIIVYIFIISTLISCSSKAQDCKNLQQTFSSYKAAIDKIRSTSFKFTDRLPSGKSSWITSANYYSCDGVSGYLIYTTKKAGQYIHQQVPLFIWQNFKNATSSGSYYDKNIKGRYKLPLN